MKKFILAFFLCNVFLLSFFASGFVDSQDGLQYLAVSRRLYYDHTFAMPEANYGDRTNIHMNVMEGKDGQDYGLIGLGYTLALLPAVALEDAFLHFTGLEPIAAFPLQNDWPVLLFASFTNSIFGALLIVTLYLYLRESQVDHYPAIVLSILLFVSSNLFPYAKYGFAHMLFTSFLFLTFYLVKKFSVEKKWFYIFGAGFSFGVVTISYNETFGFAIPALVIYYFLLNQPRVNQKYFRTLIRNALIGLMGYLPFVLIYLKYNSLRLGGSGTEKVVVATQIATSKFPPAYVIFEGIWGLLFSPGKSFFLFTPVVIMLFLFWFKIHKKMKPELVASGVLFLVYLWMIGTFRGAVDYMIWHGEASWGPRYLLPTIPLFLVLVGHVVNKINWYQRFLIFAPLMLIGLWMQLAGILIPYQIRFLGTVGNKATISGRLWDITEYGNLIPRYAPSFIQTKTLARRLAKLPKDLKSNPYKTQLRDGFGVPYYLGTGVWRGLRSTAIIRFEATDPSEIAKIELDFWNHRMDQTSTASGVLQLYLNDQPVQVIVNENEDEAQVITIPLETKVTSQVSDTSLIKSGENILKIETNYETSPWKDLKLKQIIFLQSLRINDHHVDLDRITYPYVSPISQRMMDLNYHYYGQEETDPWEIWHMHSGVYGNTFDLWWLKPWHYWDFPKKFFISLFVLNTFGLLYFGYLAWKQPIT